MSTVATETAWKPQFFGSGTCVVQRSYNEPWLYVYGPANPDEAKYVRDRMQLCYDLAAYLNGGSRPAWLADMDRISEREAIDLDGTSVTATGPLYDADPPRLVWRERGDDDDARARLMDRLLLP